MAVTVQNSTEYANRVAVPRVYNGPTEEHGRVRQMFFTHAQSGAGDAGSSVVLGKLPAGKVRLLASQSKAYVNWTTASATLDLGWDAYTDSDGNAVAADPDGLDDGLDVDAAGYKTFGNVAAMLLTGGTKIFDSQDGVVIRATSVAALADGDDIAGYLLYVVD